MVGNSSRHVAMSDAIGEHHAGNVVAAGKNRGEIAPGVRARGNGDDVSFQSGKFQRAMRFFVAGPQLHAAEGARGRCSALQGAGIEFLEFHSQ